MNKLLCASALTFMMASGASAVTVGGLADADWTDLSSNDDERISLEFIYNDNNTLDWGALKQKNASVMHINDGMFDGSAPMNSISHIPVFSIDWENKTTLNVFTEDEFTAHASAMIEWTIPSNAGPFTEALSFAITNTPDDWYSNNPDEVALGVGTVSPAFGTPTPLGGATTVLTYQWILTGGEEYGASFTDGVWINPEGVTSQLTLMAKVETVPLPAAGWMLLAGVGGLVALKRRRKADPSA